MEHGKSLKVAVIGGGVAGIVSAYLLQQKHHVSVFEANNYLGGHTNTVTIRGGEDDGLPVDTGFIVLNDQTYPLLHKFLARLGVPVRWSDMSFGYHAEDINFNYAGTTLSGLFSQRKNLVSKNFWQFLFEIKRFCGLAESALRADSLGEKTMREFLSENKFSQFFLDHYLVPMAGAIWSTSQDGVLDFPAKLLLRFLDNHGLLRLSKRPRWQTVVGGSHSYVKAFAAQFSGEILLNQKVTSVSRDERGILLGTADGELQNFDYAVIALHADEALRILQKPSPEVKRVLAAFSYQKNHTVLHTDRSVLPQNRRAWASWNYLRVRNAQNDVPVQVTYHMNRLQGLSSKNDYCVTLNRSSVIDAKTVIAEFQYTHPCFSTESLGAQDDLPRLNGQERLFFCGSYHGNGFHEDAVRSAVEVGKHFGEVL